MLTQHNEFPRLKFFRSGKCNEGETSAITFKDCGAVCVNALDKQDRMSEFMVHSSVNGFLRVNTVLLWDYFVSFALVSHMDIDEVRY
jgi:hypothetical protein